MLVLKAMKYCLRLWSEHGIQLFPRRKQSLYTPLYIIYVLSYPPKTSTPEKWVLSMHLICYMDKNTLLRTVLSAIFGGCVMFYELFIAKKSYFFDWLSNDCNSSSSIFILLSNTLNSSRHFFNAPSQIISKRLRGAVIVRTYIW